ncbi:MAG: DUF885 domain-containing protein [Rhodanobacteraceae bacterium]|nr:DUF885 domain-containing protein [Rhodanobacteraceae bacterium]MBL0042574.1 DUF885 domain-containing protein [Xanthomonadales bacterium]MBP6077178.1 DUF885 domain-containing protein [Xanthomonadales bacterium]
MKQMLAIVVAVALMAGCATRATRPQADAIPSAGISAAAQLESLYAAYWEEQLKRNPLRATALGDARYHGELTNTLTPEFRAESERLDREWLARVQAVDAASLDAQAKLSRDIFVSQRERAIAMAQYPDWMLALSQLGNPAATVAQLGAGSRGQPFATVADYEAWLKRGIAFVPIFDQTIVNLRAGMQAGVVQPRVLVEKTIPQFDALIKEKPEDTLMWGVVAKMPESFGAADRERLTAAYRDLIGTQLLPAFVRLRDFLRDDYLPASRTSVGLSALPNGAAWYAELAKRYTTTDLTPENIHQIGLNEVARITAEFDKVRAQVGFAGDLQAFFKFMNEDARFAFKNEQDVLDQYNALRGRIEPNIPLQFSLLPKAGFEVKLVEPFRAASAPAASYQGPSQDGTRPGVFYANAFNLPSRRTWETESIFLHEAIPGHHFQIALQQELAGLPAFRRFGGETAFAEGWGLYAESLGRDVGVYTDPYQYFGRLAAEIWRANRLVVDTGLHAKGWTREQAIAQMRNTSAISETNATIEVERYIAMPGQALAYKIGELKLQELRQRAMKALGDRFDPREFHRAVLEDGSLPLDVLDAKVTRWLATQRAGTPIVD